MEQNKHILDICLSCCTAVKIKESVTGQSKLGWPNKCLQSWPANSPKTPSQQLAIRSCWTVWLLINSTFRRLVVGLKLAVWIKDQSIAHLGQFFLVQSSIGYWLLSCQSSFVYIYRLSSYFLPQSQNVQYMHVGGSWLLTLVYMVHSCAKRYEMMQGNIRRHEAWGLCQL